MADDQQYHILLLPQEDYWVWVQAARDYAVHFRVSVTPTPQNAVEFRSPEQTISVLALSGGYPDQGDIVTWLTERAPTVPLDVLSVTTPAGLHDVLAGRMAANHRFGTADSLPRPNDASLRLRWPTDFAEVVQPFAGSPELYRQWGLPGHEGVDIKAPINANVYACADGEVYRVHDGTGGHPYGIHVRIRHADGYKTIYAHLNQALVHTAQVVRAGDVIGLADSTGNTTGGHLHLTLKKKGATASGLTPYPGDILDPTPYLVEPVRKTRLAAQSEDWPYDKVLFGLHARIGGPMEDADWQIIRSARADALKVTSSTATEVVDVARQIAPDVFVLVHLLSPFGRQPVQPREFVRRVRPDLDRFYGAGVCYFEIHHEPNLTIQGNGVSWRNGAEFGDWFLEVVGLLRGDFPEARFGWPGLSVGEAISGMRVDYRAFLSDAARAVSLADFIAVHCHWEDDAGLLAADGGLAYRLYLDEWPDKTVLITEFSNPSPQVDPQIKGGQYLTYLEHLQAESGVGGAFAFVVSAAAGYSYEVWRTEDGQVTPIMTAIATRSR